ncbi:MAG: rhodanese-like domain-containing protein [Chloroflexi bacterium]|nr:rhodanese-like domain-containing protein [Chloroflexota bacterium]
MKRIISRYGSAAALLVMAAWIAGACGSSDSSDKKSEATVRAGGVTLLDAQAYRTAIGSGEQFVVNVHVPYEGEIEGTDAFVPFDQIDQHVAELPTDKTAPLYIYCRSGRMSGEAAPVLQRLGYTNIIDLRGGMNAWRDAGLAIVNKEGRP